MKEFRIARCLTDGEINEYAIFADGSRKKIIQTDEQYGKYFEVDNELNTNCKSYLRFSYSGRIKDAVEMIRNGNGDCIMSTTFLGRIDRVVYFLDRQIGEELRQKSLEGWKDTKFGWVIKCGYKNSFSGYSIIDNNTEPISKFSKDKKPMVFDTKEAADEYVENLIKKARHYAEKLVNNISDVTEKNERYAIIDNMMDEIKKSTGAEFSIIFDFAFDMITGDCMPKSPEYNLDNMGYDVIQYIIQ